MEPQKKRGAVLTTSSSGKMNILELVQANLDKPWNWAYLSRNQSIKKVWLGARAQEQARLLYTKVCTGLFQEVACGISTGRQHHHSSVGKRNRPQRE